MYTNLKRPYNKDKQVSKAYSNTDCNNIKPTTAKGRLENEFWSKSWRGANLLLMDLAKPTEDKFGKQP